MRSTISAKLFLVAVIGFAMAACASNSETAATQRDATSSAQKSHGNDCVFFRSVYDWQGLDDTNMVIWAPGQKDAYHIQLSMPLMGLRNAYRLAFIDASQDGRLCGFDRDAVALADDSMPQKSTIRSMARLDPEALAQLEEKYKMKLSRESKRKTPPKTPDRSTAQ